MNAWQVYWFLMLDSVSTASGLIAVVVGLVLSFSVIFYFICKFDGDEDVVRITEQINKILIPIFAITFLLSIFLPTTKQMATIYILPKIANNEQVQQIPDKLLELGNKQLDEWINEFKDVKK